MGKGNTKRRIIYRPQKQGQQGGNTSQGIKPNIRAIVNRHTTSRALNTARVAPTQAARLFRPTTRVQSTLRASSANPQFRGQTRAPTSPAQYSITKWTGGATRRKRRISRKSRKHHETGHRRR